MKAANTSTVYVPAQRQSLKTNGIGITEILHRKQQPKKDTMYKKAVPYRPEKNAIDCATTSVQES